MFRKVRGGGLVHKYQERSQSKRTWQEGCQLSLQLLLLSQCKKQDPPLRVRMVEKLEV